jgi:thiol-disulfide isomerase/thioredoxin
MSNRYKYLSDQTFAELELEDTSGNLVKTSSLFGKTVYVDFWFTTCPPCVKEIPFSRKLQQYFAADTNVAFLSICIENWERKTAWKQMIKDKEMPGIQLFYARNRPQKINLLRKYQITFPTYLLLNPKMKIVGYDAPRPSQTGWVHWSILQAIEGKHLSESYRDVVNHSKQFTDFITSLESK